MNTVTHVLERLDLGRQKYGHGVRVSMDTMTWGTPKNSWMDMAREEFLDGIVYVISDYIKEYNLSEWDTDDDNDLIIEILKTKKYSNSTKHSSMIEKLLVCCELCE